MFEQSQNFNKRARAEASGRGSVRVEWGAAVPLPRLTLGLEAGAQPTLVGHY